MSPSIEEWFPDWNPEGTTTPEPVVTPADPGTDVVEEAEDPSSTTTSTTSSPDAPVMGVSDLSGLPWQFNPPIHKSLLHVQKDLSWTYGQESASNYAASTDFSALRLGRIIMGKEAMSFASVELGTRFGFRFLYNPGAVKGGTYVNGEFIVNPSAPQKALIQEGLESISFEMMLNRMPELQGNASIADYTPQITQDEMNKIYKYGTHWDLEYLYRCANGLHDTKSNSEKTGDIGILLPNPLRMHLGPFITTGQLEQIQAEDIMFTADMVPMLTNVSIVYRRNIQQVGASISTFQDSPDSTTTTTDNDSSGSSDQGGPGNDARGDGSYKSGSPWYLAESLKRLRDEVASKWPSSNRYIGDIGDANHQKSSSEHNPVGHIMGPKYGTQACVHAIDIGDQDIGDMMPLVNIIRGPANARVWYVIYKRHIWSRTHNFEERLYKDGKDDSHAHHIHVSLNAPDQDTAVKNEKDKSSWGFV